MVDHSGRRAQLSALCLAAGRGTRLAPITDRLPKPLCPAGDSRLLALAVDRAESHARRVVVNAHHLADQVVAFVGDHYDDVALSVEEQLLGTGGAVGNIREWLGGDDLLIINADTVLTADTGGFVESWDGERLRMLVVADPPRADFHGVWRYAGVALVPNGLAVGLPDEPANLSDELFVPERAAGRVELIAAPGLYVDCATPFDLLVANLTLNGGDTVVSDGAVLVGSAESSLLLPGARVERDEVLRWVIRLGDGGTIDLSDRFR